MTRCATDTVRVEWFRISAVLTSNIDAIAGQIWNDVVRENQQDDDYDVNGLLQFHRFQSDSPTWQLNTDTRNLESDS